ncbi:MAG: tetratricopeptide repeat protein [Sphingomonas sp.]|uniref:tetratricopeptide repeat protein n=1 Tax=Sphingomonas sp. TaxID=28214 RepID=UPI001B03091B|nr:tetratricopeptide repeat protein [Sphingomonas sp.]MBO9622122.1 tetratricopeptide repeat protein [Sphingomonas sp.]
MRNLMAAAAIAIAIAAGGVAQAQTAVEGRVDKLEREMRAVQRKVFPGGAGQLVEPQITPTPDTSVPGVPASAPLADLTQRVAALEGQLTTLTGQIEQGEHRLRQLEEGFEAYKAATDARLKAVEGRSAPAPAEGTGGPEIAPADTGESEAPRVSARPVAVEDKPAARPTGARAQQLAAIEKPNSGDPAEDGYLYGYRLWSAKLYPEARKALEAVVTQYPKHRRASYAQNLLGRAYLDAGAPSLAAVAFYENYKKNPNGDRAPDSLYYLAQALTKLKKPASEVCKVYDELTQLYGGSISAEIKAGVAEGRAANKCK